jgi:radical SAM superfamily enzyme YgiQ (UPF0313 family)
MKTHRAPRTTRHASVVLVNPPWITKDDNIWHGIKAAMPPLGLLSLAAFVEARGIDVAVVDAHVEKLSATEFKDRIRRLEPRLVGISAMTATSAAAHLAARLCHEVDPAITVILGGVHPEALPEETLRDRNVEIVVRGDGEETLASLISAILEGRDWRGLDGISFREESPNGIAVRNNPPAEVIHDLGALPFPAYHLVPMNRYYPAIGAYRNLPAINLLMTRGCPGRCTFCNSARTPLRAHPPAKVVEEISHLQRTYGIREIQFYDDTFTVYRKNVTDFCRTLLERKIRISWCAFARADGVNDEMLTLMKKAGCHQIMFGIESGDPEILKRLGKPIALEATREAVRAVRRHGIEARGAFVYGLEGETLASLRRTRDFALSLELDLAVFNIATPYPGTALHRWAKTNGYLLHEDWTEYELGRPILELPTVSPSEVAAICAESYRAFYRRPRTIARRLWAARTPRHWIDMAGAFSFIMLRRKVGARGHVRQDWLGMKKEDFFDFDLAMPEPELSWKTKGRI